jgi:hypothetical protein
MEDTYALCPNICELPMSPMAADCADKFPQRIAMQLNSSTLQPYMTAATAASEDIAALHANGGNAAAAAAAAAAGNGGSSTQSTPSGAGQLDTSAGSSSSGGGSSGACLEQLHFFGVYDGHGGTEASLHCAQRLHHHLSQALSQIGSVWCDSNQFMPCMEHVQTTSWDEGEVSGVELGTGRLPPWPAGGQQPACGCLGSAHEQANVVALTAMQVGARACNGGRGGGRLAFTHCCLPGPANHGVWATRECELFTQVRAAPCLAVVVTKQDAPLPITCLLPPAAQVLSPDCTSGEQQPFVRTISATSGSNSNGDSTEGEGSSTSSGEDPGSDATYNSISCMMEQALRNAFLKTDEEFSGDNTAGLVGSTAVVALVGTHRVWIANCGDSRAVLSRNGRAIQVTDDHKPEREDEAVSSGTSARHYSACSISMTTAGSGCACNAAAPALPSVQAAAQLRIPHSSTEAYNHQAHALK